MHQVQGKAGTASLSSSQFTLMATDGGTKEVGLIESVCEDAGSLWSLMRWRSNSSPWTVLTAWLSTQGLTCTCVRPLLSLAMLEDKGFHLTVKDGCRKLGGHGREINERRLGNSNLVDAEFQGGLLECEKSMLRGRPGLVAPVDSGVAGICAVAGVDERRAVTISTPEMPSREAVESHQKTHIPFAP